MKHWGRVCAIVVCGAGVSSSYAQSGLPSASGPSSSPTAPTESSNPEVLPPAASTVTPGGDITTADNPISENNRPRQLAFELPEVGPTPEGSLFIRDLNSSLMSPALFHKLDELGFMKQMQDLSFTNGYFASEYGRPFQPMGMTPAEEVAFRQAMANTMISYMTSQGIPDYLRKRLEKESIVATMLAVHTQAKNFKIYSETADSQNASQTEAPKNPWELRAGLSPRFLTSVIPDQWESFVDYSNPLWKFQLLYVFGKAETRFEVHRRLREWALVNHYHIDNEYLEPRAHWYFAPRQELIFKYGVHTYAANFVSDARYTVEYKLIF